MQKAEGKLAGHPCRQIVEAFARLKIAMVMRVVADAVLDQVVPAKFFAKPAGVVESHLLPPSAIRRKRKLVRGYYQPNSASQWGVDEIVAIILDASMEKQRRGRPSIYRDKIIALKRGKSIYFANACQNSLKSIVSRIGSDFDRHFATSGIDGGVWVERNK